MRPVPVRTATTVRPEGLFSVLVWISQRHTSWAYQLVLESIIYLSLLSTEDMVPRYWALHLLIPSLQMRLCVFAPAISSPHICMV